jgi:hypothetical protein
VVWVKVTDQHPRQASRAGLSPAARCLHMDALCWIMLGDNETPVISRRDLYRLSEYDDPDKTVLELVECEWWGQLTEDTWEVIHDVGEQRTNEQILADRDRNARRQAKFRDNHSDPRNAVTNGVSNGPPGQARPVVTPNGVTAQQDKNTLAGDEPAGRATAIDDGSREDVERLCTRFADLIAGNGFTRPAVTKAWRRDMRLLLDADGKRIEGGAKVQGHPEDNVLRAIEWCQQDGFWYKNVRSPATLRKQYERMQADARDEMNGRRQVGSAAMDRKQAATDAMFDGAMERARDLEAQMEAQAV